MQENNKQVASFTKLKQSVRGFTNSGGQRQRAFRARSREMNGKGRVIIGAKTKPTAEYNVN